MLTDKGVIIQHMLWILWKLCSVHLTSTKDLRLTLDFEHLWVTLLSILMNLLQDVLSGNTLLNPNADATPGSQKISLRSLFAGNWNKTGQRGSGPGWGIHGNFIDGLIQSSEAGRGVWRHGWQGGLAGPELGRQDYERVENKVIFSSKCIRQKSAHLIKKAWTWLHWMWLRWKLAGCGRNQGSLCHL